MAKPTNPEDETPKARSLDKDRVESIHRQYALPLERFLLGLLRQDSLAQDALQSTFAQLIEKGGDVASGSLKSWLYRVAFNEAMMIKRRASTRERHAEHAAWTINMRQEEHEESVEDLAMRSELLERVRKVVSELPAEQRTIVQLRIFEQTKFKDISEQLNVPLGTVLSRMQLALKRLRRAIPPEEATS